VRTHQKPKPPREREAGSQPRGATPELIPSPRSRAGENAWLIAGVLMVSPYFIPLALTPFSAQSWPAIQTLISATIAGVSLVKLLPKFGPDSSIAQVYWRGVGYFLTILALIAIIEIIGGF
jgi:hypothetical protein